MNTRKKVSNAERSDKMNNTEYARKVNEAKQKLEKAKTEFNKNAGTGSCGTAKLKSTADSSKLGNSPGVYILRLMGR